MALESSESWDNERTGIKFISRRSHSHILGYPLPRFGYVLEHGPVFLLRHYLRHVAAFLGLLSHSAGLAFFVAIGGLRR